MLCCSWIPLETLNGSIQIARREKSISYATFLKYEYLSLNYFCLLKFIKFQKQNRQNQKQDFHFSILAFLINTSTLLILSSFSFHLSFHILALLPFLNYLSNLLHFPLSITYYSLPTFLTLLFSPFSPLFPHFTSSPHFLCPFS